MASNAHAPDSQQYYVPHGSPWPIIAAVALFMLMWGAVAYLNDWGGAWVFLPGPLLLLFMFAGWFNAVIGENQLGVYNSQVDRSFRMGMMWFIFSEVMFFAAFFGALFYSRVLAVPWLGGEQFQAMSAYGIAAINTLILLTSGLTVTIAHHALRSGNRARLKLFLALTFVLGFCFVALQAHEYYDAYTKLNLRLTTGIYGSTFFMLTGFHGLHVTIGAIMLLVVWLRVLRGHFTPRQHFAFEAVSWYWHFVDVVWLGLFIFVYWR